MNRGTLALLAVLLSCPAAGAQAKVEAVDRAAAWLVVNEQALGVARNYGFRNTDNPNTYIEVLSAAARSGYPRIELWFGQLYGGRYWSARTYETADRIRKMFVYLRNKPIQEIRKTTFRNHLGPGEAVVFRLADRSCIGFQQIFGDVTLGQGNKDLFGYYCAAVGDDISDGMIAIITRQYGVSGPEAPPPPDEKSLAVLEALGRGAEAAVPPPPSKRNAPFVLSWEGEADRLSGTVTFTQEGGHGEITIPVPEWSATCSGRWQYESGKYGTVDLPKGIWRISCSNGLTAAGSYVSDAEGRGTGTGRDARGRAVRVSFGQ